MRFFVAALLLAFSVLETRAQSRSIDSANFNGKQYLRLGDWARAEGFEVKWIKPDEELQLSKGATRIQFITKSRESRFNDIQLWLLLPLESKDERVYISQLDIKTTLEPLIAPARLEKKIKTICLDPGHGGKDPGNKNGTKSEKDFTLALAKELSAQLKKAGFKVSLTRNWDSFIELWDRPAIAKKQKADLFISLHFNGTSSATSEARGAETYALTPAGGSSTAGNGVIRGSAYSGNRFNSSNLLLAYQIQKSLVTKLNAADRGVRRARYEVLREATMPSVLIEGGFLSNPGECKKIFDSKYRREMARAIVEGIQNFKRAAE